MQPYRFRPGPSPLLVSIPHLGNFVPEPIAARMTPVARTLADTDWHLDRLYDFLDEIGASVLEATHSRYVIDLNRPPDDESLYPGRVTTGLVPVETFAGEPIWLDGERPDAGEIDMRREQYWKPYHERLQRTLEDLRARHGVALLWDAHSIRSVVPRLFDGRLPDFNLGTADGRSCDPAIAVRLAGIADAAEGFSSVLDGRFKGGYITRRYGQPRQGVHAVQLELALATYMDDGPPYEFQDSLARVVRPHLRAMLQAMLDHAR
ncbi:MAG TPA: N-formylglutamate deformylase [Zeimonas sp.]